MPRKKDTHAQVSFGDAKLERDNLGQIIMVPYFCRHPGCDAGWPNRYARNNHERTHLGTTRRKLGPKPQEGTLTSYYWHKRNNLDPPRVDKNAWNAYYLDWKRKRDAKGKT